MGLSWCRNRQIHINRNLSAQEPFDHSLKIFKIARLINEVVGPEFLCLHHMHQVAMSGKHNGFHIRVLVFNEFQHCEPVDLRHLDIK